MVQTTVKQGASTIVPLLKPALLYNQNKSAPSSVHQPPRQTNVCTATAMHMAGCLSVSQQQASAQNAAPHP